LKTAIAGMLQTQAWETIKRLVHYLSNTMNLPQQTVSTTPAELAKVAQH